ncbi:MAG: hypothetical protein WA192_02755 [Candidatus Acidiferrales bacterium]
MPVRCLFWGAVFGVALLSGQLVAQDRTAELRFRFEKESNPVHKAKLVPPLADAEFRQIHEQIDAGNLPGAAQIAGQLRDEAAASKKALDARHRDVESHPDGYKQLEISVRESVRRLDDILVGLDMDDQKPFLAVRADLDAMDQQMIHKLFPKQPDSAAGAAPPPKS